MQNVLVTGGAGFIGSNFIRYLLSKEPSPRIINLDAITYAGNLANLPDNPDPERYVFCHGNICDSAFVLDILRKYKIDTIVHFAAETHVDRSIAGTAEFVTSNIVGTSTLLDCARQAWCEDQAIPIQNARFHHISTDEVFGTLEPDDPPFNENTRYSPRSPYSASKASSDHLVRAYYHTFALPVSITNCSNNYGPNQFPEKLIPLIILNALEGKPLPIYGDGLQIRDWLFVEDHCEAIHTVIKKGRIGDTYLVGGNNQIPNIDIVKIICSILDELRPGNAPHSSLISFVDDRPGHDRRYALNTSKITSELDWQPRRSLEQGLRETVLWYLQNNEWVSKIRGRVDYDHWLQSNYAFRGMKK